MPRNAAGVYVPLTHADQSLIASYIGGVLRTDPTLNALKAAIKIGTRFDVDQSDTFALYKIIGQERAANALGETFAANPGLTPDPAAIPQIPFDPADAGQYVTTYVVTMLDPATGEQRTSMEQSITSQPIDQNDLLSAINSDRSTYLSSVGSPLSGTGDVSEWDFSVLVLNVFRAA